MGHGGDVGSRIEVLKKPSTLAEAAFGEICKMGRSAQRAARRLCKCAARSELPFRRSLRRPRRAPEGRRHRRKRRTLVGELMPPFRLQAYPRRLVSLEEVLAAGPAVISFNRGRWSPFCKIELSTIAQPSR